MSHKILRRGLSALVTVVTAVVVVGFATHRLSYVTTHGVSMLPLFHTGDLALVVATGGYRVGQIVAYRSPTLHTTVLHRIIAEHNGIFTFKGDNNNFVDVDHLGSSSIEGRLFLHIPHGGEVASWIVQPLHAAFVSAIVFGLLTLVQAKPRRALRGARGRHLATRRGGGQGRIAVGALGALALGTLTLASFRVPETRTSTQSVSYTDTLAYSYGGTAAPGTTYPRGRVVTGEPVFLKLANSIAVRASYRFTTSAAAFVSGSIGLRATVVEPDGWSHPLASVPPVEFNGPTASAQLVLPLTRAVVLLQQAANETGIGAGGETVVVTPELKVRGALAGQSVSDSISTPLTFELSPLELSLPPGSVSSSGPAYPQLVVTHPGSVEHVSVRPGSLTLFGRHFNLRTARLVGAAGALLALALSLAGLASVWRRRGLSEEARTRHRYRHELFAVESDPAMTRAAVVDVAALSVLTDLTDRFEVALLDFPSEGRHTYFAEVGEILYRYRSVPEAGAEAEREDSTDGPGGAEREAEVIPFAKAASA